MNQLSDIFLTSVNTPEGAVTVITKTNFLLFFSVPRTSVMLTGPRQLVRGIQFRWNTNDWAQLEYFHDLVVQTLREITLTELRYVADVGKRLMSMGLPFVPEDAALPEVVKAIGEHLESVI